MQSANIEFKNEPRSRSRGTHCIHFNSRQTIRHTGPSPPIIEVGKVSAEGPSLTRHQCPVAAGCIEKHAAIVATSNTVVTPDGSGALSLDMIVNTAQDMAVFAKSRVVCATTYRGCLTTCTVFFSSYKEKTFVESVITGIQHAQDRCRCSIACKATNNRSAPPPATVSAKAAAAFLKPPPTVAKLPTASLRRPPPTTE